MESSDLLPKGALEAILDALESLEDPLLAWGVYDGTLSEDEVEETIEAVLDRRGLPAELDDVLDARDDLQDAGLILPISGGYRTRIAEHLRLLRSLRQLFPDRRTGALTDWRGRPSLVDAVRYVRRPRQYPIRDVDAAELISEVTRKDTPQRTVLTTLTTTEGMPWRLAGFQDRATRELLAKLEDRQGGGAIVGAGTGSGKTLAFYLPAFTHIAGELGDSAWTKVLALYPRNELLKDQLQNAVEQARDLIEPLYAVGERPIRVGAIFGGVPQKSSVISGPYGWDKIAADVWRCPYLRCPERRDDHRCHGDLIVRKADLEGTIPKVRCADCQAALSSDIFSVTRAQMRNSPPDMLFSSTEMLSRALLDPQTAHVFGIGTAKGPELILLDEVHTYGGTSGAMTALTLRRWRSRVRGRPVFVGLSATLLDAPRFFGDLVGAHADQIADIQPDPDELVPEGAEYLTVVRSDPTSRASVLSTSIQTAMLLGRTLDHRHAGAATGVSRGLFGTRTFLFTDDLDVNNRLYFDLLDAEGQRHRRTHNRPFKPSLAHLRSPSHGEVGERGEAGQIWNLAEQIGHDLGANARLGIGRTTSQDVGLDETADIVVATSSLEVGVDDDAVGAVMQHKAPRDAAAFLQRKGRAGRNRGSRPITTVVVSDYGRDREAFEGWDRLVDPTLEPSALPVGNTHVLRMQAAAETLAWAVSDVEDPQQVGNLWTALRRPSNYSSEKFARRVVLDRLNSLLENSTAQQALSRHLAHAMSIEASVVEDLMWRPPRAVLLGLVPGMIRRVEDGWSVAGSSASEDAGASQPMPEFIPRALFAKLALPELIAELPQEPSEKAPPVEQLGVIQGIRELAPGRITKRFAIRSDLQRAWVDPTNEDGLEVASFVQLRQVDGNVPLDGAIIPLVRPLRIQTTRPDKDLSDSTHGRPRWTSTVITGGDGLPVRSTSTTPLAKFVGTPEAFLHRDQRHAEVRRGAWAFDVTLKWQDGRQDSTLVELTDDGAPVALGAAFDVDALRLRPQLPPVDDAWTGVGQRALRTDYHRYLITTDDRLVQVAGPFHADRFADLVLLTVAQLVVSTGTPPDEAWTSIEDDAGSELQTRVGLLLADPTHADEDAQSGGSLGGEMRDLLSDPQVVERLVKHASALWRPLDDDARAWLQLRLLRTIGESVLAGARLLCPEHDPEGLLVDVEPSGEKGTVWISEEDVGGGGFLEALVDGASADPGRFLRLVHAALHPGPEDLAASALRRAVAAAAGDAGPLPGAFTEFRGARGAQAKVEALHGVRQSLKATGIPAAPAVVSSIANRLLRVGSDASLDTDVDRSIQRWDALEAAAECEVPLRVWTLLDALSDGTLDARRHDRLQTVLWPRGSSVRNRRLESYNPFQQTPSPAPDVLLELLADDGPTPIPAASGWPTVAEHLAANGEVWVEAPAADPKRLLDLLTTATVSPIDLGYLRLHARPSEVRTQGSELIIARLDLPDVGEHARGDSTPGLVEPDTRARRINTTGNGPGPVRDVMHTTFVGELLQASSPLWIVSAWLSDVVVVDNRGGELLSIAPGLPVRELRLVEVLTEIVSRGGAVEVAVRKHPHNRSIVGRLKELASRTHTGTLRVQERPDLHDKIVATDRLLIEGSMNLTHRGAEVNEEGVRVLAHPADVGEQRMELRSRFGDEE